MMAWALAGTILIGVSALSMPTVIRQVMGMLIFIVAFTWFDCVGWGLAIHRHQRWHDRTLTAPYRIIQHLFMASLALNVLIFHGWPAMAGGLAAYWFGCCDVLFYLFLRLPMPRLNESGGPFHYDWMEGWSVHGLLKAVARAAGGKRYACHRRGFVGFAILGFILGLAICLGRSPG